jgi:predicted phosphodiesterase
MRIAIISDIHGNLPALEAVVNHIHRRGVDLVVNLGDSASGPLLPRETVRFLMAQEWVHLAGNHERQVLELDSHAPDNMQRRPSDAYARAQLGVRELAWMASLKSCQRLNDRVLLCHGTPRSDLEYFAESVEPGQDDVRLATPEELAQRLGDAKAELVACGHTHVPRSVRAPNGTLIVNPGSVGLQAYDDDHPTYHRIQNGSPDARYSIVERLDDVWVSAVIAVPYDYRPMAELAERNGRPDWAHALRTGYMPPKSATA